MEQKVKIKRLKIAILILLLPLLVAFSVLVSLTSPSSSPSTLIVEANAPIVSPWDNFAVHAPSYEPIFTQAGLNHEAMVALQNTVSSVVAHSGEQTLTARHFSSWVRRHEAAYNFRQPGGIFVRLFEHLGAPAATYTQNFTENLWRPVFFQDGVLTLFMHNAYRWSAWCLAGGRDYSTSTIRNNIVADFDTVLTNFPNARDSIVPVSEIPWQQDQPQSAGMEGGSFTYGNPINNPTPPANDIIWLPSVWELENNSTTVRLTAETSSALNTGSRTATLQRGSIESRSGLWEMNGFDRAFTHGSWPWGRSNNANGAHMWSVTSQPYGVWSASTNHSYSVHPAIHIRLGNSVSASFTGLLTEGEHTVSASGSTFIQTPGEPAPSFSGALEHSVEAHSVTLTFNTGRADRVVAEIDALIGGENIILTPTLSPSTPQVVTGHDGEMGRIRAHRQTAGSAQVVIVELTQLRASASVNAVVSFLPSTVNTLESLEVLVGGEPLDLTEVFAGMFSAPQQPFSVGSVQIVAVPDCPFSVITGAGTVALSPGSNDLQVSVQAQDLAIPPRVITISIPRTHPSNDNSLESLLVLANAAATNLTPAFTPTGSAFSVSVSHAASSVVIIATPNHVGGQILNDAGQVQLGPMVFGGLEIGDNVRSFRVRAENGGERTITLTINRAHSAETTDSSLFNLAIRDANDSARFFSLSPLFNPTTLQYTVTVPHVVDEVLILAEATFGGAAVTVLGGNTQTLNEGSNIILIRVDAYEGGDYTEYTVTIIRQAAASDALLDSLSVDGFSFSFNPHEIEQGFLHVPFNQGSVMVRAVASDANATIQGAGIWSGLINGERNELIITVTAENGDTMQYILVIFVGEDPALSANELISLSVRGAILSPSFTPGILEYSSRVGFFVSSVEILAITPPSATITINGEADTVVSLNPNAYNTILIVVTAYNGDTITYTIDIFREAAAADAAIENIFLGRGVEWDSGQFVPGQTNLAATVPFAASTILLSAVHHPFASVDGLGLLALAVGVNSFEVVVVAQDGVTSSTIYITITREADGVILPPATEADREALLTELLRVGAYITANGLNYTTASRAVVNTWIENGWLVFEDPAATQGSVNAALANLTNAYNSLVAVGTAPPTTVDKSRLQALYNSVLEHLTENFSNYTVASRNAVLNALNNALTILNSNLANQGQVDLTEDALQFAFDSLVAHTGGQPSLPVYRQELVDLIFKVLNHLNDPTNYGVYTPLSLEIIGSALEVATGIANDMQASQGDINATYTLLGNAFNSRVRIDTPSEAGVNRQALINLRAEALAYLLENSANYTPATVAILQNALDMANLTLNDTFATQSQIDNAYAMLRMALDGLEGIETEENGGGFFRWPGFPGIFTDFSTFWPWLFYGLALLLVIMIIVIAVVVTKKKRTKVDDGELDECRSKARDAINQAFSELRQAGELVTACEIDQSVEQAAMMQLSKTDAAMRNAETCVAAFLKAKKTDKKKAK